MKEVGLTPATKKLLANRTTAPAHRAFDELLPLDERAGHKRKGVKEARKEGTWNGGSGYVAE